MNDVEAMARVRRGLAAELALFASGPGGELWRSPGVVASIAPAVPERSIFNGILADDAAALAAVYDALAARYRAAGVRAFTAWIEPGDRALIDLVSARGHVLDARPTAMAAELDALTLPPAGDLDWCETDDLRAVGRINDAAYGLPPSFARGLERLPPGWRAYLARVAGEPVACTLAHLGDDRGCGIAAVATLPSARGGGRSTRLLGVALAEARRAGAIVTTLQATSRGRPVYERLGYRGLGAIEMWEHRT